MVTLFIIIERVGHVLFHLLVITACFILNVISLPVINRVKIAMPSKNRSWHPLIQASQVSLSLVAVNSVQLLVPPYFIFIAYME